MALVHGCQWLPLVAPARLDQGWGWVRGGERSREGEVSLGDGEEGQREEKGWRDERGGSIYG